MEFVVSKVIHGKHLSPTCVGLGLVCPLPSAEIVNILTCATILILSSSENKILRIQVAAVSIMKSLIWMLNIFCYKFTYSSSMF